MIKLATNIEENTAKSENIETTVVGDGEDSEHDAGPNARSTSMGLIIKVVE